MSFKPSFWPTNPYLKSVFPMERCKYSKIVPDEKIRTALSGMLGREFWEIASDDIWKIVEAELDTVKKAAEKTCKVYFEILEEYLSDEEIRRKVNDKCPNNAVSSKDGE